MQRFSKVLNRLTLNYRLCRAASKFVSWNTHGLNHPVKCGKVFSHLKKSKADVVYLQKTHLRMTDHSRIKQGGFSQIFHSKCHAKCHGSAILIYRDVQFVESKEISDKNGCFVIVPGKLFNMPVVLASIYAPSWDNDQFFCEFFSLTPIYTSREFYLCPSPHIRPL